MQVTPRKMLPALGLAAAALASMANVSHAAPQILRLPGGNLTHKVTVGKHQLLRVNFPVKLLKGAHIVLDGGTIELNSSLEIAPGAILPVRGGELKGLGKIVVRPSGTFRLTGSKQKKISGLHIENAGILEWGGTGRILCGNGTVVNNTGTMYLNNGANKHAAYPATTAKFENHGSVIDISQGRGATIQGNFMNYGAFKMNAKAPDHLMKNRHHIRRGAHQNVGVYPTSTLIMITGTFGSANSTFQTTINASYYGQLYVPGSVSLGGTFKYVLSPTTLNPGAGPYDVILAGAIGVSDFAAFTSDPTPFRFTHQKNLSGSPKKYQLVNYTG